MAPGKKQKKSKKKESKGQSSGLARIASQLVPSAIFAAVPRTSTNLAQTWPKRAPSPIAQAISEAGNVGRIVLGDLSKRPPAEIPVEHREGNVNNDRIESDREEAGYESVGNFGGTHFDKKTKYFSMTREGQGAEGESPRDNSEHFYHILDHESGQIVESLYSQVDKKKKKAMKAVDDGEQEEREFLSEYSSSDELTDVTSREDESNAAKESHARRSVSFDDKDTQDQSKQRRKSKKERRDRPDSIDGLQTHRNSKKKTSVTVEEVCEGAAEEDEERPPPVPPYLGETSPQAPKRSRRKGQEFPQEEVHGPGKLPDGPSQKKLTDEQKQALRVVERLGFEGVSEKLDLSDISDDDDDSYMSPVAPKTTVDIHKTKTSGIRLSPLPRDSPENTLTDEQQGALKVVEKLGFDGVSEKLGLSSASEGEHSSVFPEVPRNTIDFHGRTSFEQEQFGDTLMTESSIPVSDARMEEANLTFSHSIAGQESPEVADTLQSLKNHSQNENHEIDFQRQARKANKVSSFVQKLNQQARQRDQEQLALHRRTSVEGLKTFSSTKAPANKQDIIQDNADPSLIQRLEESRQAFQTAFLERQEQLESLVQQQKALYEEQIEQQKVQQQQQHEVVRQQWKLQEQLRNLEKMQQEFAENADLSAQAPAVSALDLQLQRELVRQQQDFLQKQQEQLQQSGVQQTQVVQQQERLCNQIKLLEEQQKELQSSVHLLSPAGKDLAEIKQQEQLIMSLLSEQRQQESEFKRLHVLQQQRLEEQSSSFTHERKALEQQQEMLQQKIKEQEARSKQLEQELKDMARKHADSEAQLKRRISLEADSAEVERRERLSDRNQTETTSVRYDKEGRRRSQDQASLQAEEGRHRNRRNVELERREKHGGRVAASYNKARRRHQESDNSFHAEDERPQQNIEDSDLSLCGDDTEGTQPRRRRHNVHETSDYEERESPHRNRRIRPKSSPHREGGERHLQERVERREANSPGSTVDRKPLVGKSNAAVTVVQDAKDSEVYHLSKRRIELLEAEKSAFMELNTSLQEENKALKQLALSLQKGSGISSVVLQQQIKELHQEQKFLRDTVHRLNVELSRYQAKYRPVSFEEVEGFALPQKNEAAPWLVNTKFLAPLFVAYDDRLKEKEQMIKTYDAELNAFKVRVMEVVKENQQLHMSLNKASPDSLGPDEWQQLQEQAKLVVEENALLMEQQEIQARKMKELQRVHGQEVSKLSKRISSQESVQRRLETDLEDLRRNHSNLLNKYEVLVGDEQNKMSLQEHLKIMEECRSVIEDLKAKTQVEAEDSSSRVQAIQKEKNNLAVKLADSEARNAQLKRELDAYQKSLKKSERKFLFLQRKLEHIQERELTAQETLSQVLTVAEKTAAERDNYVEFAKTQKVEQERAVSKILAGTQNIKGLEDKLQEYRRKASDKVAVVTGRLREKEKEINQLREQYETEINNLRALVRQKQRQLELMIGENRNVEKELELVWRTATADNERMKNTVRQKGGMFDSDSDPNGHLSSEEGDET